MVIARNFFQPTALLFVAGTLAIAGLATIARADGPRVLQSGELPNDARLAEPVSLHDYHPFRPVASAAEWEQRQRDIRDRVQLAAGLWPMPTKTPLNVVIHGKVDMDDYSVERVFFESMPGNFVSGSLYRPAGESLAIGVKNGKRPGVLCPHGHWKDARFYDAGEAAAKQQIVIGAERFESAARNPLQARCVQLARMGCVVFHYDMIGDSDSIQFAEHRRGPRGHMISPELGKWGFVSPQSTARLQTNFGLQTWNSVRALDFLLGLEEIDPARVLATGASGGGTQTQMVSAIDDRVTASFPCVMPSTAMQGGCTCENSHLLRIGQGNIDIAAATAPRPLGMTAADDWTIELETKGYPDLVKLYTMVGAPKNYEAHFNIHFKHNYNHVSRTQMYQFVNRHFALGLKSPVLERDFTRLEKADLTVWTEAHPAPTGDQIGDTHERALNQWWATDSDAQVAPLLAPKDAEARTKTQAVIGRAVELLINRKLPTAEEVNFGLVGKEERNGFIEMTGLIGNDAHAEEVPAAFAFPGKDLWKGKVVIWISPEGKAGLFDGNAGTLREPVRQLVDRGIAVVGLDLFKQGEFLNPGETVTENPRTTYSKKGDELPADSWQRSAVYFYGYNDSIFARRVHDILTAVAFIRNHETWDVKELSLTGSSGTGHWVAAARAIAGGAIDKAVVDSGGFRFEKLVSDWDADFIPGAVKIGDLAGFLTVSAPNALMLIDDDDALQATLKTSYQTSGAEQALRLDGNREAMLNFLAE
ncbi:MAG: acetylxylan esterase [Verrucomicrobiae bacterium]|nr:acetylxylan esterase [Verrucomicrobiae bacterium]